MAMELHTQTRIANVGLDLMCESFGSSKEIGIDA